VIGFYPLSTTITRAWLFSSVAFVSRDQGQVADQLGGKR